MKDEQYSLEKLYPELLKEWDYEKNTPLTPSQITPKSGKKVWWICIKNKKHQWQETIANRTKGRGCPFCAGKKVLVSESFGALFPDISKEWNYQKNCDKDPYSFTPYSNKKVWWICNKGHEWQATIGNRVRGSRCPFCLGIKATKENCLAITHPNLAKEWHPTKNKEITPFDVTYGTQKKFWWKCSQGHEWEASCNNRSRGRNCPYCTNKLACQDNCLKTTAPNLLVEWHPTKNNKVTPEDVTLGSEKKVWWKCCICEHEWEARVNKRAKGQGCPKCKKEYGTSFSEQAIYYYISLIFVNAKNRYILKNGEDSFEVDIFVPELNLAIEYDGEQHRKKTQITRDEKKNEKLNRMGILLVRVREEGLPNLTNHGCYCIQRKSHTNFDETILSLLNYIKYKFLCFLDRDTLELISNLKIDVKSDYLKILEMYKVNKQSRNLSTTHPNIAVEWHPTKNGNLKPHNFTFGSNVKVWWRCSKGHEWQATINHRTNGTGCPYCKGHLIIAGESLADKNKKLTREWHPTKNGELKPNQVAPCSNKKVWWLCSKGHEWKATVNNRHSQNKGCPYCYGRFATKENCLLNVNPNLAKQWHPIKNEALTPRDVKPNSGKKVWWLCPEGHEWEAVIQSRNKGNNCPYCARKKRTI
ncbi:zinc-ribbon domain-containing protein [Parageobacillus thermoglucosidasius]|uniref:Treble clef zinc finger domain-containing protein n=1 Tax=Parageobacillus thermoglucosidasius TaxID=1426 RepID=A0AB38R0C1_PARTM|nr:zinc-ribbon domain-containing protein [Parageobacillus thermoglucosidasius]UOE75846.1 hypothetical protein IMI45_16365 [Parageobacillus thermoglucosidasius]